MATEHVALALYELDGHEPCAIIDHEGIVRVLPSRERFDRDAMPEVLPEIVFANVLVQLILKQDLHVGPLREASPTTGPRQVRCEECGISGGIHRDNCSHRHDLYSPSVARGSLGEVLR